MAKIKNFPSIIANVDDLIPYARNSRTHSAEQITQIAASIKEFGFTNPVLIDKDNGIIAGHGRVMAAKKLGLKTVPCIVASGWTDAQKKAYVIADNKLALNAGWDESMLKLEFEELQSLNFNIELVGFSANDLQNIFLDKELGKTDKEAEWEGMPEFTDLDPCFRKVIVSFDDQEAVEHFFALLGQDFTEKTKSVWHPKKEKQDLKDSRWTD